MPQFHRSRALCRKGIATQATWYWADSSKWGNLGSDGHKITSTQVQLEKIIMKAIRIHSYGGPEVLAQVEMQRPALGANEVLIKVHAASVNPFDWKARAGYMKEFL